MCLFTHFAAGALAGGATGNVWAGAVAGIASHAVLDVIPHYDHPDWRLELAGGIFALILLLVMPFSSAAAVVGGIFGMVPDLENLFQKLGRMKRSSFVFPTHTGLLPHGRELGPRSLVWQVAIFVGCFLALGLVAPGEAAAATLDDRPVMGTPTVRLLEQGQDRSVVRVTFGVDRPPADWRNVRPADVRWALPVEFDDSDPDAPRRVWPEVPVSLAVPTRRAVQTRILDVAWWRSPDRDPGLDDRLAFGRPAPYRGVPVTGTAVPVAAAGGILREVTLEILHPATGRPRDQLSRAATAGRDRFGPAPAATPGGILNADLFAALARGGVALARTDKARAAEFDPFVLTGNWVKLEVTATGVHRVTGQDLLNFGVATGDVDPTKLRVYRGGGRHLTANPEIPDTLQADRVFLNEVAIRVLGGEDGEWNLDDEVRFYGFGSSAWLDRFDPAAPGDEFYDHPYSAHAVYWLTWETDASASPLPGAPRRATLVSSPPLGGTPVQQGRVRLHRERQVFDEAGLVEDDWTWDNAVKESSMPAQTFSLRKVVADSAADFSMDVRGRWFSFSETHIFQLEGWLNADEASKATLSISRTEQESMRRVRLLGRSAAIVPGLNTFKFYAGSTPAGSFAAFDCFDIFYWARLDVATGGGLEFVHPADQVPAAGTAFDFRVTAAAGAAPVLWDVTDPAAPVVHAGQDAGSGVHAFGLLRDPVDRHLVALDPADALAVDAGRRVRPVSLRGSVPAVDYLVIHAPLFAVAAADLAAYRSTDLPGVAAPAARAVSAGDVYDNFSGGQKDPRAIRNYLRRVYEQGGMRLSAVCLVGNASRDFRNYKDRDPAVDLYDFLPTELRTSFPATPFPLTDRLAYASDDGLVSFDWVGEGALDVPDLAVGRLPAGSLIEARALVDRAVDYARSPEPGPWRNHLLFAADDCISFRSWPTPIQGEQAHTIQAENLSEDYLPFAVDLEKTYGVAYDFPPSSRIKPAMRADINASLSRGTTMYYYVGHGAEDNLSDEQIFQSSDISNLGNGMRRPLFVAFSCDVGVFDSPGTLSMAEKFILGVDGGAIGSICASQVSFSNRNNTISNAFFENLYPGRRIDPGRTVGAALVLGKAAMFSDQFRKNSQKYNLMGDPALRLPHPVDDLDFADATPDTMYSGRRMTAVVDPAGGKTLVGPGDRYELLVEEAGFEQGYIYTYIDSIPVEDPTRRIRVPRWDTFPQRGGPVFRGSGVVGTGTLEIPFMVPVQLRYGDNARLRLLVAGPGGENAAVRLLPSVRSATGPNDDVFGPDIAMAFENDRYTVRPGTPLTAALTDTSGIAILGTAPGNSLLLEFDESGFMIDVTPSFTYEPNSFTQGRLSIPLPADLGLGRHSASLHGSDALGNVGSDTLSFEVAPAGVSGMDRITLFPNPTPGPCRLIFELSDPMEVQWEIYTTSGRRLKTVRRNFAQAGPRILEWDGRDDQGDEIANGTYLYVLRGFGGAEEGRDITNTGKLVIMR